MVFLPRRLRSGGPVSGGPVSRDLCVRPAQVAWRESLPALEDFGAHLLEMSGKKCVQMSSNHQHHHLLQYLKRMRAELLDITLWVSSVVSCEHRSKIVEPFTGTTGSPSMFMLSALHSDSGAEGTRSRQESADIGSDGSYARHEAAKLWSTGSGLGMANGPKRQSKKRKRPEPPALPVQPWWGSFGWS